MAKHLELPVKKNINFRLIFGILLFIYLMKSLIWVLVVPIFQAPDENRHYNYIAYLAKYHKIPLGETSIAGATKNLEETVFIEKVTDFRRVHFSPREKTTFIPAADSLWEIIDGYPENDKVSNFNDPENIYMGSYPPLYYSIEAMVYRLNVLIGANLFERFYALRIFQVILSSLILILIFKILKRLGQPQFFIIVFIIIYISWPQLSLFAIGLQPDVLATFFTIAITLLFIKQLQEGVRGFYWKLGLLYGFLLLTKFHLFLVMSSLIGFYIIYERIRSNKWRLQSLVSIMIAFAMASPWFIHNLTYYGVFLPHANLGSVGNLSLFRRFWYFLSVAKKSTFPTSIGYFGWRDTRMPDWFYYIFYVMISIALIGVFYFAFKHVLKYVLPITQKKYQELRVFFLESAPYYVIYLPMLVHIALMLYLSMTVSPYLNDQGRHYFTQVFPLLLIFVQYSRDIWKTPKWGNAYLIGITCAIICSNIYSLYIIWQRYYVS